MQAGMRQQKARLVTLVEKLESYQRVARVSG